MTERPQRREPAIGVSGWRPVWRPGYPVRGPHSVMTAGPLTVPAALLPRRSVQRPPRSMAVNLSRVRCPPRRPVPPMPWRWVLAGLGWLATTAGRHTADVCRSSDHDEDRRNRGRGTRHRCRVGRQARDQKRCRPVPVQVDRRTTGLGAPLPPGQRADTHPRFATAPDAGFRADRSVPRRCSHDPCHADEVETA